MKRNRYITENRLQAHALRKQFDAALLRFEELLWNGPEDALKSGKYLLLRVDVVVAFDKALRYERQGCLTRIWRWARGMVLPGRRGR